MHDEVVTRLLEGLAVHWRTETWWGRERVQDFGVKNGIQKTEHGLIIKMGRHYERDPAERASMVANLRSGKASDRAFCLGEHKVELFPTVEVFSRGVFCR